MIRIACLVGAMLFVIGVSASCSDDETEVAVGGGTGDGGSTGGAAGDGGEAGGAQCLDFGDSCVAGDVCCDANGATGACYAFGMGSRCTIPCPADPADCPNGGQGCNMMAPAYCKPPA